MKSYETQHTFHNFIAMLSKYYSQSLIVVMEGHDDLFLLKEWVSSSVIVQHGEGGKGQILRVAERFVAEGNDRVRFVVDRDYDDYVEPPVVYSDNVVVSRYHDCFTDVLSVNQRLLARVVDYHLDSYRRSVDERARPASEVCVDSLVDRAFELALMMAACRIVDLQSALSLNFKAFKFRKHANEMLDASYIMRCLLRNAVCSDLDMDDLCARAEKVVGELQVLDFPLVGDHDLFAAVNYLVSRHGRSLSDKVIRSSLLTSISVSVLRELIWCNVLEGWASSYRIGFFEES
jgi:hypothetical protein